MSYLTIKEYAEFEFEEKKSRFIGQITRVESEEEARAFLKSIKDKHKEARHNVYAYVIGENSEIQRYSDDGEPQGTGGIPMLEVIRRNKLSDVAVVVTRYFGGILLGTGGLTRAYTKGTAEAIASSEFVEKVKGIELNIKIEYDLLGKIQYFCQQKSWFIENIIYTDRVELIIYIESNMFEQMTSEFNDITSGMAIISKSEQEIYFKSGDRLYKL